MECVGKGGCTWGFWKWVWRISMKNICVEGSPECARIGRWFSYKIRQKKRIRLWKWGIWLSCIGLWISCSQRETFSDANIAQVDYVLISLKQALFDVKHLEMHWHWRQGLCPTSLRPHWGSLRRSPRPPNREGLCALGPRVPSAPLFVPTHVRNVRPGSIILWPGYALVTMKVWRRHWVDAVSRGT